MKIKRYFGAVVSLVLLVNAPVCAGAAEYKDVPETHFAYGAVDNITDKGLMLGDLSGNFNPNDFINKFDTTVILAKAAGYKQTNVSAEEQAQYSKAYEEYKTYINQFVTKYDKWNSSVNMEIAYLLDKGIYVKEDLLQFFKLVDDQDKMRALSKEEASVFLVRLLGKEEEAKNAAISDSMLFKDDSSISAACRPHVYYLKSKGIITGDATGAASNFYPASGATKAVFAVMLHKTLALMPDSSASSNANTGADNNANTNVDSDFQTVYGTISKIYSSFRALYVLSDDVSFNGKIYPVSQDAVIKVNGYVKLFSDLQPDMEFTGVIQNGEITVLTAMSLSEETVSPPAATSTPTPAPTSTPAAEPAYYNTLEGTVYSFESNDAGYHLEIQLRLINPKGSVYTENRIYTLSSDCPVYRGETLTSFSTVATGDIVTVKVSGDTAYYVKLEEKNRSISGTLTEKNVNSITGAVTISVTDSNKKNYELALTEKSILQRNSVDVLSYAELRAGDTVEINTEYDNILRLTAYGTKETSDVWVQEISITAKGSRITVLNADNEEKTYPLIGNTVDVYSLRIGSKVRLRLDSWEVETVTLLQEAQSVYATGYIYILDTNTITLSDVAGQYYGSKAFTHDANTVFVDSLTGNRVTSAALKTGMKLYIVYSSSLTSYAKTVTILSY